MAGLLRRERVARYLDGVRANVYSDEDETLMAQRADYHRAVYLAPTP